MGVETGARPLDDRTLAAVETEVRSILGNLLLTLGLLILPHDERKRLAEVIVPHVDVEVDLLSVPPHG
jgi:hypothetical protein